MNLLLLSVAIAIRLEDALAQHRRFPACALHRVRPRQPETPRPETVGKVRQACRAGDAGSGMLAPEVRRSVKRRRLGHSALVRRAKVAARAVSRGTLPESARPCDREFSATRPGGGSPWRGATARAWGT
ncbi:hypothetical protein RSSE_p0014 (plasmid) [Ralstonia solanacearum]|nr:hypothetical protein RSSE_p0014 [Ralstonia solanacearum]